jgi:hypothetical protein
VKTEDTAFLEEGIYAATSGPSHKGVIGVHEVGFGDEGIVDYITIEPATGEVRCYELKVTKSDFLSDNKLTWIGDYNYYVVSDKLYPKVASLIRQEKGIGCWVVSTRTGRAACRIKPSRRDPKLQPGYVMGKIVQALSREYSKTVLGRMSERIASLNPPTDANGYLVKVGDNVKIGNDPSPYPVASVGYDDDGAYAIVMKRGTRIKARPNDMVIAI